MSKKVVMFEYEKETKNSVRYKEIPDEGTAPVIGTLYVQKWFAGDSKSIEITIDKKDYLTLPFMVIDKASGKIIGSTRFCHADVVNQRVEVGYTWYAKSSQRSSINTECKMLLLTDAFEVLDAIAVEFRTHWHNQASRQAIARLGAKQDCVLRNHQKGPDDLYRDTVVFSIINLEWPAVKMSLLHKLAKHS